MQFSSFALACSAALVCLEIHSFTLPLMKHLQKEQYNDRIFEVLECKERLKEILLIPASNEEYENMDTDVDITIDESSQKRDLPNIQEEQIEYAI